MPYEEKGMTSETPAYHSVWHAFASLDGALLLLTAEPVGDPELAGFVF